MLFHLLGDRGAIYENIETANNTFKVRTTARYEKSVYMPGAYLIYESASIKCNIWREFLAHRTDNTIPISRETFHFLNKQTAYVYPAY